MDHAVPSRGLLLSITMQSNQFSPRTTAAQPLSHRTTRISTVTLRAQFRGGSFPYEPHLSQFLIVRSKGNAKPIPAKALWLNTKPFKMSESLN